MRESGEALDARLDPQQRAKLERIKNPFLHQFLASVVDPCAPAKIFVSTGSEADRQYVRQMAQTRREEAHSPFLGTPSTSTVRGTRPGTREAHNFCSRRAWTWAPKSTVSTVPRVCKKYVHSCEAHWQGGRCLSSSIVLDLLVLPSAYPAYRSPMRLTWRTVRTSSTARVTRSLCAWARRYLSSK